MTVEAFAASPRAESVRRVDFERAEVVSGIVTGTYFLVVAGALDCWNAKVALTPRVYKMCPRYWGIELTASLHGFCLGSRRPFTRVIPLGGVIGADGIEVIGATRVERFEIAGGCDADAAPSALEGVGEDADGPFRRGLAFANFQPIVSPRPLHVRVDYHLNRRSGSVRLRERQPQGINPTELILDLVIDADGNGGDWVPIGDRFAAAEDRYRTVRIYDPHGADVVIPVQQIHL